MRRTSTRLLCLSLLAAAALAFPRIALAAGPATAGPRLPGQPAQPSGPAPRTGGGWRAPKPQVTPTPSGPVYTAPGAPAPRLRRGPQPTKPPQPSQNPTGPATTPVPVPPSPEQAQPATPTAPAVPPAPPAAPATPSATPGTGA